MLENGFRAFLELYARQVSFSPSLTLTSRMAKTWRMEYILRMNMLRYLPNLFDESIKAVEARKVYECAF